MRTLHAMMTTGDVVRATRLSPDRIRDLDDVLQPEKLPSGHRRYRVVNVERFLRQRAKRKAA